MDSLKWIHLIDWQFAANCRLGQCCVMKLEPSSGVRLPVTSRMMSTIHQMPTPPKVSSLPTAVPVCPKQNRSIPRNPNRIEYSRVVRK